MADRIKLSEIKGMLKRLNGNLGTTRYTLDQAYGGYRLESSVDGSSGIRDISFRQKGREMYDILYAMNQLIENEQYHVEKSVISKPKD